MPLGGRIFHDFVGFSIRFAGDLAQMRGTVGLAEDSESNELAAETWWNDQRSWPQKETWHDVSRCMNSAQLGMCWMRLGNFRSIWKMIHLDVFWRVYRPILDVFQVPHCSRRQRTSLGFGIEVVLYCQLQLSRSMWKFFQCLVVSVHDLGRAPVNSTKSGFPKVLESVFLCGVRTMGPLWRTMRSLHYLEVSAT